MRQTLLIAAKERKERKKRSKQNPYPITPILHQLRSPGFEDEDDDEYENEMFHPLKPPNKTQPPLCPQKAP
jgi:hypothetical protein